jgi:mannose-1-phosphate guanylyltransferase / phosphomannomutase
MKAIIFAHRSGEELTPFTHRTAAAMLPVAVKPIIEYSLESLLTTDIRDVVLVVSNYAEHIEQYVANGEKWGLKIEYMLAKPDEPTATILQRCSLISDEPYYLLMRADALYSINLKQFIDLALSITKPTVTASIEQQTIGIALVAQTELTHTDCIDKSNLGQAGTNMLEVEGNYNLILSLSAYFETNMQVAGYKYKRLVLHGRQINEHLRTGRRCTITDNQHAFTGDYCYIHPQAHLSQAIIGHEVIVDRNAVIKNSLILGHTYVGEGVELCEAIVWGNQVVRLDLASKITVLDELLLADLRQGMFRRLLAAIFNRSLGIILLFLSMPLWILALLLSLPQFRTGLIRRVKLLGNHKDTGESGECIMRSFHSFEWATAVPVLRYLPRLLAVVSGDINLVGVSPTMATTIIPPCYQQIAPVGLLGPGQIDVPASAPTEERVFAESHYAATRKFYTDLKWLLIGLITLFTPRAWLPPN